MCGFYWNVIRQFVFCLMQPFVLQFPDSLMQRAYRLSGNLGIDSESYCYVIPEFNLVLLNTW